MGFGDSFLKKLSQRKQPNSGESLLGIVFVGDKMVAIDLEFAHGIRKIASAFEIPCRGDRESALTSLVEKNGWKGRKTRLCLTLFDYQTLIVERPKGADDDELRNSLAWTLREELDDRPENVVFDVCEGPSSPEGIERIHAVSMPRNSLDRTVTMFAAAGLVLEGIDIAPLCLGRALRSDIPSSGHLIVLHMEPKAGSVFIYGDANFHMAKRLPRGTEWLAAEQVDSTRFDLLVNDIAVSLRRSADEYRREHGWLPDDLSVCLTPLAEYSDELVAKLQDALGWEVSRFDARKHYELGAQVSTLNSDALMAVGAAL